MKNLLYLSLLLLFSSSCSDFIEYPLENKKVDLIGPISAYKSNDSSQTFWWNGHEDAKSYRFQLVSPNFSRPGQLIMDSLVDGTKIILKLDSGKFQWRVRPENYGSVGFYGEHRDLWITK